MRCTLIFGLCLILLVPNLGLSASSRLLVDQGHGQAFVIEKQGPLQLSRLAESFRGQGWKVTSSTSPLTPELLANTDALIISGAFKPFSKDEITAVAEFIENGGCLAVMIHIGPPLLSLLHNLGVDVANGVLREQEMVINQEPLNFHVTHMTPHPLTRGLEKFALYGGWPLRSISGETQILARSGKNSWVDLNKDKKLTPGDAIQEFGVLVGGRRGQGKIAVFADDALFQNRFLKEENQQLLENLGHWLQNSTPATAI